MALIDDTAGKGMKGYLGEQMESTSRNIVFLSSSSVVWLTRTLLGFSLYDVFFRYAFPD